MKEELDLNLIGEITLGLVGLGLCSRGPYFGSLKGFLLLSNDSDFTIEAEGTS